MPNISIFHQGFVVTDEQLQEVEKKSEVLNAPDDFLSVELRNSFNILLPEPENIKSNEFVQSYLLLKQEYQDLNSSCAV